jgi:hypothetical protein
MARFRCRGANGLRGGRLHAGAGGISPALLAGWNLAGGGGAAVASAAGLSVAVLSTGAGQSLAAQRRAAVETLRAFSELKALRRLLPALPCWGQLLAMVRGTRICVTGVYV